MDILVIQLKREELILASFRPKRGGVSFLSAERHQLTGDDEELVGILEGAKPSSAERRVVLALPPQSLYLRELELPIKDRAKVRELLPLELKGETALDSESLSFDALPMAGGKFLAVWGRTRELAKKIELLKGAGLEPEQVTASLYHWNKLAPAAGTVAVTDGEALAAYRDGEAVYFRAFPAVPRENEVDRTVAALEISAGLTVDRVISLAGKVQEGQWLAAAPRALGEAFAEDAHAAHDLAGAYAVAAAVADGSSVNLRRGALAYTAANEKLYKKLRISAALAILAVLMLFAETGVRYYIVKRDIASLDQSVRGIYKEIFPNRQKPVDEVAEVRSEIRRLEGAKTSSNVLKLLSDLAQAKGDDVAGFYETSVDGQDVLLKADARNFQAANDFKTRAAKLVDGAEVSEVKSKPDGSVTFTFHGTMKGVTR